MARDEDASRRESRASPGEVAGKVAHDLNNALTIIKGNLQILGEELEKDPSDLGELVEDALSASEDATELTRRISELGRELEQSASTDSSRPPSPNLTGDRSDGGLDSSPSSQPKANLMSLVSHQLRTPLSVLHGFTRLLMTEGLPEEKRRDFIKVLHEETDRLTALVNNLLALEALRGVDFALDLEPLNLIDEISAVVESLTPAERDRISILSDELPSINVDKIQIRRAFGHVIANALRFDSGGGPVEITAKADSAWITIGVRDRGIGIPENDHETVFDDFATVRSAEHEDLNRSGLGLALVKSIVDRHGGKVRLESRPGSGSLFSISLPRTSPC